MERGLVGAVARRFDRAIGRSLRHQLSRTRPEMRRLIDDLPGMSIADRTYTTLAIRESTRRWALFNARMTVSLNALFAFFLSLSFMSAISVIATLLLLDVRLPKPDSLALLGSLTSATILSIVMLGSFAGNWRSRRPDVDHPVPIGWRLLSGTVWVSSPVVLAAMATASAFHLADGRGWVTTAQLEIFWALVPAIMIMLVLRVDALTRFFVTRLDPAVGPLDGSMPKLLYVVVDFVALSPAWRRPDVSRFLIHRVEGVARSIQPSLQGTRVPFSDRRLRKGAEKPFEDLASVVRDHKRRVADVRTEREYLAVTRSLAATLAAMARNDWDSLLRDADPSPRSRWYRKWSITSLVPALVLMAGALALPWLPPFRHSGASSTGIRTTLGVYAALRLIPGPSLVDLYDKSLTRGFDGAKKK